MVLFGPGLATKANQSHKRKCAQCSQKYGHGHARSDKSGTEGGDVVGWFGDEVALAVLPVIARAAPSAQIVNRIRLFMHGQMDKRGTQFGNLATRLRFTRAERLEMDLRPDER